MQCHIVSGLSVFFHFLQLFAFYVRLHTEPRSQSELANFHTQPGWLRVLLCFRTFCERYISMGALATPPDITIYVKRVVSVCE